jgi:hypothetical protein
MHHLVVIFTVAKVKSTASHSSLMMEAIRTSETSVDNHFTRQYNPEDNSEHNLQLLRNGKAVPLHVTEALVGIGGIAPTHSRPRH